MISRYSDQNHWVAQKVSFRLPCQVVVNYSASEGPAQEVVAAIKEAGGDAVALQGDVADP